jgi:branched-chain amino acid transport system permease protein
MSGRRTTDYRQELRRFRTTPQRFVALFTVVVALAVPFVFTSDYRPPLDFPWSAWLTNINFALIAVIGAAAFNLLLGYTHQVSVAHAAFLMLGTMVAAYFGVMRGMSLFPVLAVAMISGALVGAIVALPALRFRSLYLLIATFGVHYIALFGYRAFQARNFGYTGIRFPRPTLPAWIPFLPDDGDGRFVMLGNFRWYWLLLILATLSVWFMANLVHSREGRAFRAIGERDVAASLIGIDVTRSKLLAFAASSAFVSLAGALSSFYLGARGEDSFPFLVVLNYAIMIIVGGISSMTGAVFGAFFFYLAPLLFRWATVHTPGLRSIEPLQRYESELHLAIFGALIITILILRPSGIVGAWNSAKRYFARWPYSS